MEIWQVCAGLYLVAATEAAARTWQDFVDAGDPFVTDRPYFHRMATFLITMPFVPIMLTLEALRRGMNRK